MLFPPREAMTTAEPPETLIIQHSEFIIYKESLQEIDGPAARHSCPVVSISGSISIIWLRNGNVRHYISFDRIFRINRRRCSRMVSSNSILDARMISSWL